MPFAVRIGYSTGFFSVVGQMYDVNGLPSMVTSTRRSDSLDRDLHLRRGILRPSVADGAAGDDDAGAVTVGDSRQHERGSEGRTPTR